MADLLGLNVLNTRPLARAASLQSALLATGARVQQLPLLEIDALPLTAEAQQWLRDLDRYRWVFVVSPTAAELGLQHLADYWPQWPLDVQWLAVGDSTAQVLRQHLLSPMIPDEETSEGLLRLPIFQQLHRGDRLLVLRGEGGRNLVREHLITQGVRVDYIELYRRQLPAQTIAGVAAKSIIPLVISPRLAILAENAGLKACIIAKSSRANDIIDALITWRNSQKHDIDDNEPTHMKIKI